MITGENIGSCIARILQQIPDSQHRKKPYVIALDGMCASGKSTLAKKLAEALPALLIHADDYYPQTFQRTEQRFAEPGGNLDRERLLEQVLLPAMHHQPITLQKFNCQTMKLEKAQTVQTPDFLLVEGTYSLHPLLYPCYDLRLWSGIDPKKQMERLAKRETPEKRKMFAQRWIPFETRYFNELRIRDKADLIL